MSVLPKFFLTHDLPDNTTRFAYHRDLLPHAKPRERFSSPLPAGQWTWIGVRDDAEVPVVWSGDWLVAAVELDGYRVSRAGERKRDGWAKRDEPYWGDFPLPPDRLWDDHGVLPDQPAESMVEHYREHDAEHACWDCRAFAAHYCPRYVIGPDLAEYQSLEKFVELPGGMPPLIDPADLAHPPGQVRSRQSFGGDSVAQEEMVWTVDDPSVLAVYGHGAAHLFPGRLSGLRSAVGVVLAKHPSVGHFYDWHNGRSSSGKEGFSLRVRVPWETPRTKTVYEKPTSRSRKKVPREVPVYAIEQEVSLVVPQTVAAPSLQAALDGWDATVEAQVRRFFPYGEQVTACDHCEGRGYHAGSTS